MLGKQHRADLVWWGQQLLTQTRPLEGHRPESPGKPTDSEPSGKMERGFRALTSPTASSLMRRGCHPSHGPTTLSTHGRDFIK